MKHWNNKNFNLIEYLREGDELLKEDQMNKEYKCNFWPKVKITYDCIIDLKREIQAAGIMIAADIIIFSLRLIFKSLRKKDR